MFRTASARHEMNKHFQDYVERLTRVLRLLIAAQAPSLKASMVSEVAKSSTRLSKAVNEVRHD
jgi:hypothetical protein